MDNRQSFIECFKKYQKTCIAYNNILRENRMLILMLTNPKLKSRKEETMSEEEQLRELAYFKWEQAGCPQGDGVQFWLQAEAELSDCPKKKKKVTKEVISAVATKVAAKTSNTPKRR